MALTNGPALVAVRRTTRRTFSGDVPGNQRDSMATPLRPRLAPPVPGYDPDGRDETPLERCDHNLVELLQEVRVVQTGVQVLFAFLLTAPLAARFPELTPFQRYDYFTTLLAAGAAAVLLIAPTAYHRILFRCGDKEHLVIVANRFTLAGLAFVALSMIGALFLVTGLMFDGATVLVTVTIAGVACVAFWCVLPLLRRAALRRP